MPTKKLIKIISSSLVGLATLGFATYKYNNLVPIVDYPGDFKGKITAEDWRQHFFENKEIYERDISLERIGLVTTLEVKHTPEKTIRMHPIRYYEYYCDIKNDGTVDSFYHDYSKLLRNKEIRSGKNITKEDQLEYNKYLTKIAQIKLEKSNE